MRESGFGALQTLALSAVALASGSALATYQCPAENPDVCPTDTNSCYCQLQDTCCPLVQSYCCPGGGCATELSLCPETADAGTGISGADGGSGPICGGDQPVACTSPQGTFCCARSQPYCCPGYACSADPNCGAGTTDGGAVSGTSGAAGGGFGTSGAGGISGASGASSGTAGSADAGAQGTSSGTSGGSSGVSGSTSGGSTAAASGTSGGSSGLADGGSTGGATGGAQLTPDGGAVACSSRHQQYACGGSLCCDQNTPFCCYGMDGGLACAANPNCGEPVIQGPGNGQGNGFGGGHHGYYGCGCASLPGDASADRTGLLMGLLWGQDS